jgi:hypothetical protein
MRHLVTFALIALLLPSVAESQTPASNSPEDVVAQIWVADSARDWEGLLRLAHPEALRRIREAALWSLRVLHSPIWDSLGRAFPLDSSRRMDVAASLRQREVEQLEDVFRVSSVDELAALPADTVFARQYRNGSSVAYRRTVRPSTLRARVLGTVLSGDTLAVIVLLPSTEPSLDSAASILGFDRPPLPDRPDFFVLRRFQGRWLGMVDGPPLGTGGLVPVRRGRQ